MHRTRSARRNEDYLPPSHLSVPQWLARKCRLVRPSDAVRAEVRLAASQGLVVRGAPHRQGVGQVVLRPQALEQLGAQHMEEVLAYVELQEAVGLWATLEEQLRELPADRRSRATGSNTPSATGQVLLQLGAVVEAEEHPSSVQRNHSRWALLQVVNLTCRPRSCIDRQQEPRDHSESQALVLLHVG